MTLMDAFKTPCVRLARTRVPDGEGGWETRWEEGGAFNAAIARDSSISARVAEKSGVTGVFTVTTDPDAALGFHDAFKRLKDGRTFRVTEACDGAPAFATFAFNQCKAEEWELE